MVIFLKTVYVFKHNLLQTIVVLLTRHFSGRFNLFRCSGYAPDNFKIWEELQTERIHVLRLGLNVSRVWWWFF